jgi:hypothetical protein
MTIAETSPAWFTMLPPFGDESPMPPPRPMRLSTPVNGLVDNPRDPSIASKRRYNDNAIVPRGAFEHHAVVLAWIKRP